MTYIYLNEYANGALYVGSHTWDGVGLDPAYHGSSRIAMNHKWIPVKETILEDVSTKNLHDRLMVEHQWIVKYMRIYGVHYLVKMYNHYDWYNRWKPGLMLNCHANLGVDKAFTAESQRKRLETYSARGESVADRFHQPGMSRKAADSHDYESVSALRAEKARGRKNIHITCKCGDIIGSVNRVCIQIGHSNWQVNVQRHLRVDDVYTRNGYTFEVLSRT